MKIRSQLALITIIVISAIMYISCTKTEKPADKQTQTALNNESIKLKKSIVDANGNVNVNLDFSNSEKYEVVVSTDEKLTQEMQGQKQSVSQNSAITYDLVVQKKQDRLFTGDMKFKRIEKSVDARQAGKQSFDSQQKGDKKDLPPNVKILMDIIGKSYQIDFNQLGRVKETRGADKMMKEIMSGLKEKDDVKKMIEMALRQEFGPEKLSDFFEKLTNYTDSVSHKLNEKWTKEYSIEAGINMLVKTTYEIVEIKDSAIKINLSSKLIDKNKNRQQTVGEVVAKVSINGDQSGYLILNSSNGFVIKSEVNQKIYVNETRSKKDDPKQSMTMKTTKDAHFSIITNKTK